MKVDFKQQFYQMDGVKTIENDGKREFDLKASPPVLLKDGPPLTLGDLLIDRMLNAIKDDNGNEIKDGKVKFRYFNLAGAIRNCMKPGAKKRDFPVEDLALFKGLVSAYSPLIVGQAWSMLEGKGNPLLANDEESTTCPTCGGVDGHLSGCVDYDAGKLAGTMEAAG